jgi:hypothetical protein
MLKMLFLFKVAIVACSCPLTGGTLCFCLDHLADCHIYTSICWMGALFMDLVKKTEWTKHYWVGIDRFSSV